MAKENIYEAYLNQPTLVRGETYVARAANPALRFDRNLLDDLDKNPDIDRRVYEKDQLIEYMADRNSGGMNVDYHSTHLVVAIAELDKPDTQIMPYFVEMRSRKPFFTQDFGNFAGYTETEFRYEQPHDYERGRLENQVKVLHIPSNVSPVVETISVKRIVLDWADIRGDMCYGSLILQHYST